MSIDQMLPWRRRERVGAETLVLPISLGDMFTSGEAQLSGATVPSVPTWDTAATGNPLSGVQTGTGTLANIWWVVVVIPSLYIAVTNLTLSIDDVYTLAGDAVIVAATMDAEVFPYDSAAGDFSNADVNATAAQAILTTWATDAFTITGTTLTANQPLLIRFTSSIQITSGGGAGTGQIGWNFARLSYSSK